MKAAAIFVLILFALGPAAVADDTLTVDVAYPTIAVTSGFAGTDVVLFGSREEGGEIIAVMRGPAAEAIVRRKHRVLGVWINTEERSFENAPSYYAIAASRAPDEILSSDELRKEQIGLDRIAPVAPAGRIVEPRREQEFRDALLRHQGRAGRYVEYAAPVIFEGAHLFRANFMLPASLPYGDYAIETLLVRDGKIAARRTATFAVVEAGVNAGISDFAHHEPLAYGLIAVAAAAMGGWIASLAFRAN